MYRPFLVVKPVSTGTKPVRTNACYSLLLPYVGRLIGTSKPSANFLFSWISFEAISESTPRTGTALAFSAAILPVRFIITKRLEIAIDDCRNPKGVGRDGQAGIGASTGRKERRIQNIEISDAVYLIVPVQDACRRIIAESTSTAYVRIIDLGIVRQNPSISCTQSCD